MKTVNVINSLLTGVGVGTAISVLPQPLNLLAAAVLAGVWLMRLRRWSPRERVDRCVAAGVAVVTVIIAIGLPMKQLDGMIGPFHYEQMSIDELCRRLRRDHRVFVRADGHVRTNQLMDFGIKRPISRREVLQKLASEADCDLRIGYCGAGATLIFGAHPGFTTLRAKIAQPRGPVNGNQPVGSETNEPSGAAGFRR